MLTSKRITLAFVLTSQEEFGSKKVQKYFQNVNYCYIKFRFIVFCDNPVCAVITFYILKATT